MKAFTYLIVEKDTGKWYYGVRYAEGCKMSDMFTSYFTSGCLRSLIKADPSKYEYQIRKTFTDVSAALIWEHKVLRRMRVLEREDCYNMHYSGAPPRMFGDNNPSKRDDVRHKLSIAARSRGRLSDASIASMRKTKIRNNMIIFLRQRKRIITRSMSKRYTSYISYIESIPHKKYRRILRLFTHLKNECDHYVNKPYPKNRKTTGPRGENPNISKTKLGKKWFTSPDGMTAKLFSQNDEIPSGWVSGMKLRSKIEKNRIASTGRKHSPESKLKMKEIRNERNRKNNTVG